MATKVPVNTEVIGIEREVQAPYHEELLADARRDVKRLYDENYMLKQDFAALQQKYKDMELLCMELTTRNGALENACHEMKCELIDLGEHLLKIKNCIINMAMQLHGGGDDDA